MSEKNPTDQMTPANERDLLRLPRERQRPPFFPHTGNPENGDYAEWYNGLCGGSSGTVVPFPEKNPAKA